MFTPLLNDSWAPVTWDIAFLETNADAVAEFLRSWLARTHYALMGPPDRRELVGGLTDVLSGLLPLQIGRDKYLIIPTRNGWSACFDDGYYGGDQLSYALYTGEQLGVRSVFVGCRDRRVFGEEGFDLSLVVKESGGAQRRAIYLINEDGWNFEEHGEPFPFEEVERYASRSLRDRLTPDLLEKYLLALGLDAFSEDFYISSAGQPALLLVPPSPWFNFMAKGLRRFFGHLLDQPTRSYTLEEARAELGFKDRS